MKNEMYRTNKSKIISLELNWIAKTIKYGYQIKTQKTLKILLKDFYQ
jgi:hypothetical protein